MLDTVDSIDGAVAARWAAALAGLRFDADCSNADLLNLIESLEGVKDACAAVQARATHEISERQLAGLRVGTPEDRAARRDIGSRIARARHTSPFQGNRYLELSRMLVRDLPETLNSLAAGRTTEHRATLIARSAACLGTAHRAALDADLGPRLAGLGNRAVQGEADKIAATLDPQAVVERHRRAVNDRGVTLRPALDTMTYLTALLPVADGVATWAALDRHATLAKAAGDSRSRGQIMADELTDRLLLGQPNAASAVAASHVAAAARTMTTANGAVGPSTGGSCKTPTGCQTTAVETTRPGSDVDPHTDDDRAVDDLVGAPPPAVSPVRQIDLMLVMTDRALFDGDSAPAVVPGHGPIPAELARELLATADHDTRVFVRRLYTDPTGAQLLTADARGRLFPHGIRQFILARDQRCRTPWCDAPIRHIDHRHPHAAGGTTSLGNAQGLCERCSLTKADRTDAAIRPGPRPRPPVSRPWASDHVNSSRSRETLMSTMGFRMAESARPS